jgi:polar amino acid transport system permease protein
MTAPSWLAPVAAQMAQGLLVTAELAALAIAAACAVGLVLGLLFTLHARALRLAIAAYVEVWRGLPVIVTLFFLFFGLPALGVRLSPLVASVGAIALWGSANLAVLVRGAVESIPRGQYEGAGAIGFSWAKCMRHIILPQALRRLAPPALNVIVVIIQLTTIASLLGVHDFLGVARQSVERLTLSTGDTHAIPILGAVLLVFGVVSNVLNELAHRLERRLRV